IKLMQLITLITTPLEYAIFQYKEDSLARFFHHKSVYFSQAAYKLITALVTSPISQTAGMIPSAL
ncbi:hypothetical protein AB4344_30060, partial [Vibrio breoganii]